VEYVCVLSLHRPVPWEIVPRPTSASGFTVPTRRAGDCTRGRLYSENTLLERVPQDFQNMAMELRQFIQEEHTMVREGHFTRHQHVAPPISAA
jgi:hypothetical protein